MTTANSTANSTPTASSTSTPTSTSTASPTANDSVRAERSPAQPGGVEAPPAPTLALTGAAPTLSSVPSSFSPGSLAAGLLLAALAVAALVLARRRQRVARVVEIVETASLGPRRSLVVARIGDELLLLGSSEGGIALLTTRPASLAARPVAQDAAAPRPARAGDGAMSGLRDALLARAAPAAPPEPAAPTLRERILARLKPRAVAPATAAFETLLAESVEDVELRRKLAAGQIGSVR
ncbi:MAG: flagellar biosynthetic protein FliO [Anaeromyxobacteraceae bacterium]